VGGQIESKTNISIFSAFNRIWMIDSKKTDRIRDCGFFNWINSLEAESFLILSPQHQKHNYTTGNTDVVVKRFVYRFFHKLYFYYLLGQIVCIETNPSLFLSTELSVV
jgi:hypothetical protein